MLQLATTRLLVFKKSIISICFLNSHRLLSNQNLKKIHSATFHLAGARDTKSTLDLLSEAYQEKIEIEKTETLNLPPNVSERFFAGYDKLSKSLAGEEGSALHVNDGFHLLVELLNTTSSKEEIDLVQKLMEMWIRSGRLFTKSKSIKILNSCLSSGRQQLAFDILCNRIVYSLRPDASHIEALIRYYSEQSVASNDLNYLNYAYQSFILNLYYDIPPTVDCYSLLIASGMYLTDPKGVERSNSTLNEMRSLGWSPNIEGYFSIIYRHLKDNNSEMAIDIISHLESKELPWSVRKQLLLFLAQAFMKQENFAQAEVTFEKIKNLPHDDKPIQFIGSSLWTKSEDLLSQLKGMKSSNK